MKNLFIGSLCVLISHVVAAQTGKHAYFSEKFLFKDPVKGTEEWIAKDSKITVDYDLKIIKLNLGDEEGVYAFRKAETEDIGGVRTTIDLDAGQAFEMLMIYIEPTDSFISFSPNDDTKSPSLLFANIKVLY